VAAAVRSRNVRRSTVINGLQVAVRGGEGALQK